MAVVQYSALVTQFRGKLGGSQFNKNHNGYSLQRKSQPTIRDSQLQVTVRQRMSLAQRRWAEESDTVRQNAALLAANNPSVDRFGVQVVLSAYQAYVRMMVYRQMVGYSLDTAIQPLPAPAFQATYDSGGIYFYPPIGTGLGSLEFDITVNRNQSNNGSFFMMLYIRRVRGNGLPLRRASWVFVGYRVYTGDSIGFNWVIATASQTFGVGDSVELLIKVVSMQRGVVTGEDYSNHVIQEG